MKTNLKLSKLLFAILTLMPLLSGCSGFKETSFNSFLRYVASYNAFNRKEVSSFEIDLDTSSNNLSIDYDSGNGYFYISEPSFVFDNALLVYKCNSDLSHIYIDNYPYMAINSDTGQYYVDMYARLVVLQMQSQMINVVSNLMAMDEDSIKVTTDGNVYVIDCDDFKAQIDIPTYMLTYYQPKSGGTTINVTLNDRVSKIDTPTNVMDNSDITRDTILNMIDIFNLSYDRSIINVIDYTKREIIDSVTTTYQIQLDYDNNYYHYLESNTNNYSIEKLLVKGENYYTYYEINSDDNILHTIYYRSDDGQELLDEIYVDLYNELYIGSDSNIYLLEDEYSNVKTSVSSSSISFQADAGSNNIPLDFNIAVGTLMLTRAALYDPNDTSRNTSLTPYITLTASYNDNANFDKLTRLTH